MKPLVPVVFATDDNFAPYCCVSIASLIANRDPERAYAIYVLYDELSEEHRANLCGMAAQNVAVECIDVGGYVDQDLLYTHDWISIATYYRFFVADVLPQYDKLLYLDSDIAILGDVGRLYDIDIGDNWLGGVVIYRGSEYEKAQKVEYLKTLGMTPETYINAGILSMNLKAFREHDVKEKCLRYIGEHRELQWMDQDVLNAVCRGHIHYLPVSWNMSQFYFEDDHRAGADVSHVQLIHYLAGDKPWRVSYRMSHLYFYIHAQQTPYAQQLNRVFLDINREGVTNARREVMNMAARADLGPRYFGRCLLLWLKAKAKKLLGKG